MTLSDIRHQVEMEIDTYVIQYPASMVGTPLPDTFFVEGLQSMRQALVEPYWIDAIPFNDAAETVRPYAVVSDDRGGYFLAFDPETQAFVLVFKDGDARYRASHIVGDAVGCFLAQ